MFFEEITIMMAIVSVSLNIRVYTFLDGNILVYSDFLLIVLLHSTQ